MVTKIVNSVSKVKISEKKKHFSSEFCDGKQEM